MTLKKRPLNCVPFYFRRSAISGSVAKWLTSVQLVHVAAACVLSQPVHICMEQTVAVQGAFEISLPIVISPWNPHPSIIISLWVTKRQ